MSFVSRYAEAAQVIQRNGWLQGDWEDLEGGAVCLLAACGLAWHRDSMSLAAHAPEVLGEDRDAVRVMANRVREQHPECVLPETGRYKNDVDAVLIFNDEIAETADEVLDFLAYLARQEEEGLI